MSSGDDREARWAPGDEDTNPQRRPFDQPVPATPDVDESVAETDAHPDPDTSRVWLFGSADDSTSLHYYGLRDQDEVPTRPSPTPLSPLSPLPATPVGADHNTFERPAPAGGPVLPPPVPGPEQSNDSPVGRSVLVGVLVGFLVLGVTALLVWWLQRPTQSTVSPKPSVTTSAITSTAPPSPGSTQTATTTATTTATATATATATVTSTVSPTAAPTAANDATNSAGWTYIIDGLGPVKVGMPAADAAALGVIAPAAGACGFAPTDALGDVQVYVRSGKVDSIDITSPAFASGRGVKVGITVAQLEEIYGDTLKTPTMVVAGVPEQHYALLNSRQYIAYLSNSGVVQRIVIGARGADGSIVLPPVAC